MALPRDVVILSDDQFKRLEELLLPGYELGKFYLEQMRLQRTEPAQGFVDLDDGKADASTAGEGIPGTMEPGPAVTSEHAAPEVADASKGESNQMEPGPAGFRKSAPAPEFDDPSKQGSG